MGKHSSPQRGAFLRSIGAWALPWALIIIVIVVALIVALDMVGDDPVRTSSAGDTGALTTPDENAEADAPKPDEKPEKQKEAKEPKEEPERDPTDEPKELQSRVIGKGVAVQVLNGTGDGEADDLMADKLARLGFTVVAVSPSSKSYPSTTVFWVGDAEEAGGLLADRFDWKLDSAPANLSEEVDLHIVVGEDAL